MNKRDLLLANNDLQTVATLTDEAINQLYTGELELSPGTLVIYNGSLGVFESASAAVVLIHWFNGVRE